MIDCCKGITVIYILIMWTQGTYGIIGLLFRNSKFNYVITNKRRRVLHSPHRMLSFSSKVYIQVFQLNDFKCVKIIQCKIEIDRTVKRCGVFTYDRRI